MHDKVFAKEIKTIIDKKLLSLNKTARITAIHVKLSPFSHVRPETLKEAFALEVRDSRLENVTLSIHTKKIEVKCGLCSKRIFVTCPIFSCPECKSTDLQIKECPEFLVESIEIENYS